MPGRAPFRLASASLLALAAASHPALGQDRLVTYTYFGTPGLLEMPSALSDDEGAIVGSVAAFGGQTRTTFTVQITDRFSGSFRYSGVDEFRVDDETYYDRSFDLRYRLTDEGAVMPMIAVGLQDFLGTGLYSSEYVVATKTVGQQFRVTAGLGWGRLGTYNGFDNPLGVLSDRFETRPDVFDEGEDEGGIPGVEAFFRGDAAVFGGVEWAPNERWVVKAEYSSDDAYTTRDGDPLFDRASPINIGVAWRPLPGIQLNAGWLYGSELAFGATFAVNANDRPFFAGLDAPPPPVALRPAGTAAEAGLPEAEVAARLRTELAAEGIELAAYSIAGSEARIRYTNTRYRAEAQAMGRVARVLTRVLPPGVERMTLEPMQRGIPLSAVTFARTDIETLENEVGGTAASLSRAGFADAGPAAGLTPVPPVRDTFAWGVRPYLGFSVFDGDEPVQVTAGAELSAAWRITPALVLSGAVRQRLIATGSPETEEREPENGIPVVRRNAGLYGEDGWPTIQSLTLAHYSRPAPNLYGRVSAGLLEAMYGGVSAELLWKPVDSRLGLGAEVNWVRQRDFDMLLSFREYETVTGHASAYYDFGNGFHGQVDAGRFLAGDWGATVALDREWENGWRVGGYFTLTDIPFEDFGEGSFDKGIRLSIPTDFVFGRPTRREIDTTLRSLNRDGGARLEVEGRLYDVVRGGHYGDMSDSWGRFWR